MQSCGGGGSDKLDKTMAPFYPNKEEKYTTELSNQINKKLGQDQRTHYLASLFKTVNSISTKKKTKQ
jgi:hypothetical protein